MLSCQTKECALLLMSIAVKYLPEVLIIYHRIDGAFFPRCFLLRVHRHTKESKLFLVSQRQQTIAECILILYLSLSFSLSPLSCDNGYSTIQLCVRKNKKQKKIILCAAVFLLLSLCAIVRPFVALICRYAMHDM